MKLFSKCFDGVVSFMLLPFEAMWLFLVLIVGGNFPVNQFLLIEISLLISKLKYLLNYISYHRIRSHVINVMYLFVNKQ